jgi:hypothetical protein
MTCESGKEEEEEEEEEENVIRLRNVRIDS